MTDADKIKALAEALDKTLSMVADLAAEVGNHTVASTWWMRDDIADIREALKGVTEKS